VVGEIVWLFAQDGRASCAFAEATLFQEILFEPSDLLVEKVIGQFDQAKSSH